MDANRTRRLLAHPASTRDELEQLLKQALAENERELAAEIRDVIDERFTDFSVARHGATAVFRSVERSFPTAKEAYIWLVNHFVAQRPEVFTDLRWETTGYVALGHRRTEDGGTIRNYFGRSPQRLFRHSPWLADDESKFVRLTNEWYANVNLSNREKFEILLRFGWVVGLKCGVDWDWNPFDPSDDLEEFRVRVALGNKLIAELDAALGQSDASQT